MGKDVEAYWIRKDQWFFNTNLTDQNSALYNIDEDPSAMIMFYFTILN